MDPNANYMGGYAPSPPPMNTKQPSKAKKMLIVVGGGLAVISVIMVLFAMIFGGSGAKQQLTKVASTQTEVARVATLVEDSRSASVKTRNIAVIIKSSALSNVFTTSSSVEAQYDTKLKKESLNSDANETADAQLESADQNNSYDEEFEEIMTTLLGNATAALNEAIAANENEKTEALLTKMKTSTSQMVNLFTDQR